MRGWQRESERVKERERVTERVSERVTGERVRVTEREGVTEFKKYSYSYMF